MAKTIQLRRYEIEDGGYEAFLTWWRDTLLPVRSRAGFSVEFAYFDAANNLFTWATSLPVEESEYLTIEAEYATSDARTKAFETSPRNYKIMHFAFVSQAV